VEEGPDRQVHRFHQDVLLAEGELREVMQHPARPRPHVSSVAVELRKNVLDEELVQLIPINLLPEEDIREGADHVQGAVLLRRLRHRIGQHLRHHRHRLLQHVFALLAGRVQQSLRCGDGRHKIFKNIEFHADVFMGVHGPQLVVFGRVAHQREEDVLDDGRHVGFEDAPRVSVRDGLVQIIQRLLEHPGWYPVTRSVPVQLSQQNLQHAAAEGLQVPFGELVVFFGDQTWRTVTLEHTVQDVEGPLFAFPPRQVGALVLVGLQGGGGHRSFHHLPTNFHPLRKRLLRDQIQR
jgi:hypothetical protein